MKNSKGFTLVEMIAVIVLIAVLSVVAVSTYHGIHESSKKKTLEAKVNQIESAAEKWARENNITNSTNISVNNLVVEGYLSADEAGTDGLAMIKNPVDGKNMICNTVDLSFKNGVVQSKFNGNVQNCKLATQSLVDSNISIRVVSRSGTNLTGPGNSSIAKWTNEDIAIIVNSNTYDIKATSISYDFGGNTVTKDKASLAKYSGTSFVDEDDAKLYYNVYFIKSELLLNSKIVVTYTIPGESSKSRAYTIRFDKEESTVLLKSNSEWITSDSKAIITVDDGKGSGPAAVYVSRVPNTYDQSSRKSATPSITLENLDIGKYYIWTEDNAKNISHTYKMILEINNVDKVPPGCEVLFDGIEGDHGWYKGDNSIGDVTPIGKNTPKASISGVNVGVNTDANKPVYTAFAPYEVQIEAAGEKRTAETPKAGIPYYCHVKSLAGIYRNATRTLYLDRTAPTLNITVDNPNTHEQRKTVHVRIQDGLSGLNTSTTVKYGLSQSRTVQPTLWSNVTITSSAQNNALVTKDFSTTERVTGTWYLWIDASAFTDYAGNKPAGNAGGTMYVFGPYKFDNTPPTCDANNGKTNWTNGSYQILQYCGDVAGTSDQSGCAQPIFMAMYYQWDNFRRDSLTIRDNAGNTTSCSFDLYLENTKPSCRLTEPGPDGDNGWYKSASVSISATFQDNGNADIQSGVNRIGTSETPGTLNGRASVSITRNGTSVTAYCFVEDVAGNQGSSALSIKKDDGAEALAGGCTHYGNTTWTNITPIRVSTALNVKPVSGCPYIDESNLGPRYGGVWSDCTYTENWGIYDGQSYGRWCENGTCRLGFKTNSGAVVMCSYYYDIYSDRHNPTCSVSKTNTWSTDGVTFNVTCGGEEPLSSGEQSGCVSSGDDQGSHAGVKSTTSYTVKDNGGNTGICEGVVYTQVQRRLSYCTQGSSCAAAGCAAANTCTSTCCGTTTRSYPSSLNHATCRNMGFNWVYCAGSCPDICFYPGSCCYAVEEVPAQCTSVGCCGCNTYNRNTSLCGCSSWSDYSEWENVPSCTAGESADHSVYTDCRTLYY